jgi:hypothetical protein
MRLLKRDLPVIGLDYLCQEIHFRQKKRFCPDVLINYPTDAAYYKALRPEK